MKKRRVRKTFKKIRDIILSSFKNKPRTAFEISQLTGIYWPTVKSHLIYLKGTDLIEEAFRHKRIKIFKLTKEGREHLAKKVK